MPVVVVGLSLSACTPYTPSNINFENNYATTVLLALPCVGLGEFFWP